MVHEQDEITTSIVRYQLPPHGGKHFGCETLEAFFAMAGDEARRRLGEIRSSVWFSLGEQSCEDRIHWPAGIDISLPVVDIVSASQAV